ncbi:hypothetical protein RI054_15g71730 [Pseudoscourfieldia marina]
MCWRWRWRIARIVILAGMWGAWTHANAQVPVDVDAGANAKPAGNMCSPHTFSCTSGTEAIAAAGNVKMGDGEALSKHHAIVVPRCTEDVGWLATFGCKDRKKLAIVLYNKCDAPIPAALNDMPCLQVINQTGAQNAGPHVTFLSFLADFYDRLPELNWFIKATVRGVGPNPEKFVQFQRKYADMNGLTYMSFGTKKLGTFHPNSKVLSSPFAPFLCRKKQSVWTASARSEFAVSRARIRRWPKCYYERMRSFLVDSNKKRRGEAVNYMLERFYNTMFSCSVNGCGVAGTRCRGRILCFGNNVTCSRAHFDTSFTAQRNKKPPAGKGKTQKVSLFGRWRSTKDTYWNRRREAA